MAHGLKWAAAIVFVSLIFASRCGAASRSEFNAASGDPNGDVNVVSRDYRVEKDETVRGNVNVFRGNVVVLGQVNGDVNVVMGDVRVDGRVNGNLNSAKGSVSLGGNAIVSGDVNVAWGKVSRAPGAIVRGSVNSLGSWRGGGAASEVFQQKKGRFATALMVARLMIFLVILLVAPRGVERVAECVRRQPGQACLVGFGVMMSPVPLVVLLAITIIGILLIPFVPIVFIAAGFLGWLGMSCIVGAKVFEIAKAKGGSVLAQAVVGLTLLEAARWLLPGFPSFFFWFVVQAFGLGAVVLTKFGTTGESLWAAPAGGGLPPAAPQVAPPQA